MSGGIEAKGLKIRTILVNALMVTQVLVESEDISVAKQASGMSHILEVRAPEREEHAK